VADRRSGDRGFFVLWRQSATRHALLLAALGSCSRKATVLASVTFLTQFSRGREDDTVLRTSLALFARRHRARRSANSTRSSRCADPWHGARTRGNAVQWGHMACHSKCSSRSCGLSRCRLMSCRPSYATSRNQLLDYRPFHWPAPCGALNRSSRNLDSVRFPRVAHGRKRLKKR
jgi:hypothetical protein